MSKTEIYFILTAILDIAVDEIDFASVHLSINLSGSDAINIRYFCVAYLYDSWVSFDL